MLTDGGVYDNLGLETAWKRYNTVLVSDGGGKLSPEEEPKEDWARHSIRVNGVIDNQVRSLRKRQLISSYEQAAQRSVLGYSLGHPELRVCSIRCRVRLIRRSCSRTPKTRLKRLAPVTHERLINWGYAICDTAMRKWTDATLPKPNSFPYPDSGIG